MLPIINIIVVPKDPDEVATENMFISIDNTLYYCKPVKIFNNIAALRFSKEAAIFVEYRNDGNLRFMLVVEKDGKIDMCYDCDSIFCSMSEIITIIPHI